MEELNESLRTLDREHDTLRQQCDDKDEEISKLRNQLQNKVKNNTLHCEFWEEIFNSFYLFLL